ncbi:MAG: hypothetical protein RIM84_10270 [Alphaproteobacteria bacterium]
MHDISTEGQRVDFRNLRSIRQIADQCPALSDATVQRWMFHRHRNGLVRAVVEIDANTYVDISAFNEWLYEGKSHVGDFRRLMRLSQVVARCSLPESKLRHWLKYRAVNGLCEAVIVKKHRAQGMLLIDIELFNLWLTKQNQNDAFEAVEMSA